MSVPDAAATEPETPNYHAIEPPHDRPPTEYTTDERRAEVLEFVLSTGGPSHVNQTELAGRYDVAQSTISRDLTAVGEAVGAHLDDRVRLATVALHDQLVADLSDIDDWRAKKAAWDVHMDLVEWANVLGDTAGRDGRAAGERTHELTETQQEHLQTLAEQARESIPTREAEVTVPDVEEDGES